jgi:hypothetical protein
MSDSFKEHAKTRPPSSAKRWIHCPHSAYVAAMYPNEESDQSRKGDLWHKYMEDAITFGGVPKSADTDVTDAMEDLLAYVKGRIVEKGERPKILVEVKLDIPLTGEFGTCDVLMVWDDEIEVLDHKSGYVPVDVKYNDQMMTYLTGAIAAYGARAKYRLSVHQPNYDHVDGSLRHHDVLACDVADFETKVCASIQQEHLLLAGAWCKDTYCPHRGACAAFADYTRENLALGWNTSEYKTMDDATLTKALDDAEELAGYRNALRVEAMRRIVGLDRTINGYKVVKGRRSRAVIDPAKLVESVGATMGVEWAARLFPDLAWLGDKLEQVIPDPANMPEEVLKSLGTPKHIENVVKQYAKALDLPRGMWETLYTNVVGQYIRETANGLSLEKAIDGRPAHRKGSEFGTIDASAPVYQADQNINLL